MQDRFKFRYVFTKDFGGKTGVCYKMSCFNLDTITDENFNKIVKGYTDYGYKLISIEQSTGLKDKNGKLIYEKDIVKDIPTQTVYKVSHKKCAFYLENKEYVGYFHELSQCFSISRLEVIGNIYENPELLSEVE